MVVGRDDAAIRAGICEVLAGAGNHNAFLRRLQLDDMPLHSALMLLRVCLVPAMNYYLRCIAPACIENETQCFDRRVLEAAMDKLGVDDSEVGWEQEERVTALLQRKLRDGGAALVPAARTSPAAFLGSLATHVWPSRRSLRTTTQLSYRAPPCLHCWIDDCIARVREAAPSAEYQADIESLLPDTAGTFFIFCTANPSATATLQRSLNAKATTHIVEAAVERMKERSMQGDRWAWAHHDAITAQGAWGWKVARPEDPHSRLSDVECAIAARLNLGLAPFPPRTMAALPEHCPLCLHHVSGLPVSLRDEPLHFLTCSRLVGEQSRRHHAVVDAIARVAWLVGGQVAARSDGPESAYQTAPRPAHCVPGAGMLTDVVVSHSLTAHRVAQRGSTAAVKQRQKVSKYARVASRLCAELLNVSVDTCGGLASGAVQLVRAIAEEGERWSAGTWTNARIERQLLGAIAVAVQRGKALTMLAGCTRVMGARADTERQTGGGRGRE